MDYFVIDLYGCDTNCYICYLDHFFAILKCDIYDLFKTIMVALNKQSKY